MDARRKAAAISAAGMFLVAGCSGGRSGGVSLPAAQQPSQMQAPANAQKMSLRFSIPASRTQMWTKPSRVLPAPSPRPVTIHSALRRRAMLAAASLRQPQYIPPAVDGGSVVIKVYQGGQQALPD